MSQNQSYTRFRSEGRSGADTYSKLFSRDNCVPHPNSKRPKKGVVKNTANLREVLAKDKSRYSKGVSAEVIGKKVRDIYNKAPAPVRAVGAKVEEATEKVRTWEHLRTFTKVLLAVVLCCLCLYSFIMTTGFRAIASEEMLGDLSLYYTELKNYDPKGAAPETDDPYSLGDLSPYSPTDLSGSDAPSVLPDAASETDIRFVSDCDIKAAASSEARMKTVFNAGLDALSSAGLDLNLYCKTEVGTRILPASVFGKNGNTDVQYVVAPSREQLDTVGCHTVRVSTDGQERNVLLIVEDTTAPTVTLKQVDIWLGDSVRPEAFISSTDEVSPLVVKYSNGEPNLTMVGTQLVYLEITDISGNAAPFGAAHLNIIKDEEPPVISGARNRTVVIGESVSYKQGVTATDNRDGTVSVKVDTSAVDPTKTGSYEVIYTAVDSNGNVSTKTVTFKFGTQDELDTDTELEKYVSKVAKNIFKDGMTDAQKIRKIYDWCRRNIGYSGHSDKGNWKKAAIAGFKKRSGDCYTYFACSKALFEYCGIENIDVVKVRNSNSESRHYWSLVDIGTGYYHFDATPRVGYFDGFMKTDAQIKSYSSSHKNSHRFDASKYPATPTASYSN